MTERAVNGSVIEDGTVRTTYRGAEMEGTKLMQLLIRCMLGSNGLPDWMVNSPHLRNPEKAVVIAASKLSWESQNEWCACSSIRLSTTLVIGSLG